jgi:hypothetical protein
MEEFVMKKIIILGSILIVFLVIMTPNLSAVNANMNINNPQLDIKTGIAIAIGKVKEFYENDTHYVINWIYKGAFIFQLDNVNGFYLGLNDNDGVVNYPKQNYTFIGITNINFFIVLGFWHEV